jgi:hypothetical protein
MKRVLILSVAAAAIFAIGYWSGHETSVQAQSNRVFELRTYTAHPGKIEDVHARFRNHTDKLFRKHGINTVVYLRPIDEPLASNTLIYLIAHPSREAAQKNFAAFRKDPDWIKARDDSENKGKIVQKVDSVFLQATDYSPMK